MTMTQQPVNVAVAAGVATITLTNPPLNVVTLEMTKEFEQALDELATDDAVRVLVVTGGGTRAFCAGSDLREFADFTEPGAVLEKKLVRENRAFTKLADFPKPTIAAIRGLAYGGGLEMASCCDLIVAEDGTRFALPEILVGVFPGSGGAVRVTRRIGIGRAKRMMYLGDPIDSATALAWGLVEQVVPAGTLTEEVDRLAQRLARQPRLALAACKQAISLGYDLPEHEAIERILPLCDRVSTSADSVEGVRAFFAKETPRFA